MKDTTQKTVGGLRVRARVRAGHDLSPGPCLLGQCPGPSGMECSDNCIRSANSREEIEACLKKCPSELDFGH